MHVPLILFFLLIQNLLFPFYRYSFNLYRLKVLLAFSHSLSNQTKIEEFRVSSTNQISWENWTDPLQNSNRGLEVLHYVWKSCRTFIDRHYKNVIRLFLISIVYFPFKFFDSFCGLSVSTCI